METKQNDSPFLTAHTKPLVYFVLFNILLLFHISESQSTHCLIYVYAYQEWHGHISANSWLINLYSYLLAACLCNWAATIIAQDKNGNIFTLFLWFLITAAFLKWVCIVEHL